MLVFLLCNANDNHWSEDALETQIAHNYVPERALVEQVLFEEAKKSLDAIEPFFTKFCEKIKEEHCKGESEKDEIDS